MEIWAHQGKISPNYPGNTLADFNQAHEIGVKGIETDVCFTAPDKNGKQRPVIHHPNKDGAPPNESLPSLDSFLELLKSLPKLSCCLELKEDNEKLVSAVVDKITEYGLEGRIYLTVCQTRVPFLQLEASAKLIFKARVQNPKIKANVFSCLNIFKNPNIKMITKIGKIHMSAGKFNHILSKNITTLLKENQPPKILVSNPWPESSCIL